LDRWTASRVRAVKITIRTGSKPPHSEVLFLVFLKSISSFLERERRRPTVFIPVNPLPCESYTFARTSVNKIDPQFGSSFFGFPPRDFLPGWLSTLRTSLRGHTAERCIHFSPMTPCPPDTEFLLMHATTTVWLNQR